MTKRRKMYEELTFTDNFIFCKVLTTNKQLCIKLLEIILDKKIRDIVYINSEQTVTYRYDGKSIRLDVYVEDDANSVYDLEMQTSVSLDLPKRSRYYQSMIDSSLIQDGATYHDLKESYVIFICTNDPFGDGCAVYDFEYANRLNFHRTLGDQTRRIFLNASGDFKDISPELEAFLQYITSKQATDVFTQELDASVHAAIATQDWRSEYMTLEMMLREERYEGKKEGLAEGKREGLAEGRALELANTEREKARADAAEAELARLREML